MVDDVRHEVYGVVDSMRAPHGWNAGFCRSRRSSPNSPGSRPGASWIEHEEGQSPEQHLPNCRHSAYSCLLSLSGSCDSNRTAKAPSRNGFDAKGEDRGNGVQQVEL